MSVMVESRTVLIVDDEPFVADIQKLILEKNGYICKIASDYDSAITLHGEMSPDLVLLDLSMDGKNGIDILKELKKSCRSNIFIVSGVNDPGVAEKCIRLGASGYLLKPFKASELLKMISQPIPGK